MSRLHITAHGNVQDIAVAMKNELSPKHTNNYRSTKQTTKQSNKHCDKNEEKENKSKRRSNTPRPPKEHEFRSRERLPVSPTRARLGKMHSRPNKCSSERPCLRIACWRRQNSHKPIKHASICHMCEQWTAYLHFPALDIFARSWPRDNGPTDTFTLALGCGKLRSRPTKNRSNEYTTKHASQTNKQTHNQNQTKPNQTKQLTNHTNKQTIKQTQTKKERKRAKDKTNKQTNKQTNNTNKAAHTKKLSNKQTNTNETFKTNEQTTK